jgi:hypothetical protein
MFCNGQFSEIWILKCANSDDLAALKKIPNGNTSNLVSIPASKRLICLFGYR